ncbi:MULTISPECIES: hypothetical protein [unclassified Streptomyces]|uniref:hypothetical protein n=1 Tax=unclassified Streptomyces TaxID=2593676 RepID=UPI002255FD05|nr:MULTISPECIES: hypothetical protein [unclassified Streptomyces]MCX5335796.1 hypothetical protein [Streptomyces sp. NBC_00140]MCX5366512.1 hypothetical protein [Streptomyces sp. NBC_00124]
MHSARMLLATAAASTVLVLGAPGAYAAGNDWEDHTDSSYSKDHDKEHDKEHGKDNSQDSPRGGMHTGGGALTAVNADGSDTAKDPKFDPETYKDKEQGKDSGSGKQDGGDSWNKEDGGDSWSKEDGGDSWSKEEKPSGGMHTGGGALASPAVTAGGLAVLAVLGTGLYSVRRKKTAGSVA